jgi:hypothetical protein
MDQKLYMGEILGLIFAHIGPMDDSEYLARREVSKDLAALARTCKTFQNPALNALWRFQYHLFPAWRCFPEDLWLASDDSDSFVVSGFRLQ